MLDRASAWRAANLDQVKVQQAAWRATPEAKARKFDYDRRRNYGISGAEYLVMIAAQGSCCAICLRKFDGDPNRRHMDHDHATGKVRAILCHHCNALLGRAQDNPETLDRAAAYIRLHRSSVNHPGIAQAARAL